MNCNYCNKDISDKPKVLKFGHKLYCSPDCCESMMTSKQNTPIHAAKFFVATGGKWITNGGTEDVQS